MFEDPNYDFDDSYPGMDYGTGKGKGVNIKKMLPIIIVAIIGIAILMVVLGYLGSQKEITFQLNELDGIEVDNANFVLRDAEQNSIKLPTTGRGSTHKIVLFPGTYTYSASSPSHKTKSGSITIDDTTSATEFIYLVRNIDATMQIIMDQPETTIYNKQEFSGKIILTNTGSSAEDVRIGADSKELNVVLTTSKIDSFNEGSATAIDFKFSIKNNIEKTEETDATISIKGTNIKEKFNMTIKPALPLEEVSLTGISSGLLREDRLKAGEAKEFTRIALKNNSRKIDLENINIEITAEQGYENELNWIRFTNYSNKETEMNVEKIPRRETRDLTFIVTPPVYAKEGDKFEGKIRIYSNSLQEDIENKLIFVVDKESKVSLTIGTRVGFTYTCREGVCGQVDTINKVSLKNDGDTEIKNIQLEVLTQNPADADCPMFMELKFDTIDSLKSNESKYLSLNIHPNLTPQKPITECYLIFIYDDPLNIGTRNTTRSEAIKITADIRE